MKYLAFDFDGTLCVHEVPEIGAPIKENIEFLKLWKKTGHKIIIWTCRSGQWLEDMVVWLHEHDVPYDFINENPDCETGSRKVFADIYYDDRSRQLPSEIKADIPYSVEEVKKELNI